MKNESTNIKKGITYVLIANFINLFVNLAKGFILPKFLTIKSYADIQTYLLYTSYVGILHLGYLDGIYLKYGGKDFKDISQKEFNICRNNTILLNLIVMLPIVIIAFMLKNFILLFFAVSILPLNMKSLYNNIFQATAQFKNYSKITNISSFLSFIGSVILLFVFRTDYSLYYILALTIGEILVWVFLEYKIIKDFKIKYQLMISLRDLRENIKSGILLMLGNFSSVIMTGIDRWFVKFGLTVSDFAFYSFSVRMESLLTVFISPITTTMYNYLCKNDDVIKVKKIIRICIIAGLVLIGSAFPIKFILEHFLIKYESAKTILFILFATQSMYLIIKGVYVNLYKARKQQKKYFVQLVFVIVLGAILNLIALKVFNTKEAIAFATLISVIAWMGICMFSIKEIILSLKELLFFIFTISLFILLGFNVNSILGFCIYYIYLLLGFYFILRESLVELVSSIKNFIKNKLKRKEKIT